MNARTTLDAMHPQGLINTGSAWRLEGHVGRTCHAMIESGIAILGSSDHRDYWGNHVPSRDQVVPGTKGSVEYANERLSDATGEPVNFSAEDFDAGRAYDFAVEQGLV